MKYIIEIEISQENINDSSWKSYLPIENSIEYILSNRLYENNFETDNVKLIDIINE